MKKCQIRTVEIPRGVKGPRALWEIRRPRRRARSVRSVRPTRIDRRAVGSARNVARQQLQEARRERFPALALPGGGRIRRAALAEEAGAAVAGRDGAGEGVVGVGVGIVGAGGGAFGSDLGGVGTAGYPGVEVSGHVEGEPAGWGYAGGDVCAVDGGGWEGGG